MKWAQDESPKVSQRQKPLCPGTRRVRVRWLLANMLIMWPLQLSNLARVTDTMIIATRQKNDRGGLWWETKSLISRCSILAAIDSPFIALFLNAPVRDSIIAGLLHLPDIHDDITAPRHATGSASPVSFASSSWFIPRRIPSNLHFRQIGSKYGRITFTSEE